MGPGTRVQAEGDVATLARPVEGADPVDLRQEEPARIHAEPHTGAGQRVPGAAQEGCRAVRGPGHARVVEPDEVHGQEPAAGDAQGAEEGEPGLGVGQGQSGAEELPQELDLRALLDGPGRVARRGRERAPVVAPDQRGVPQVQPAQPVVPRVGAVATEVQHAPCQREGLGHLHVAAEVRQGRRVAQGSVGGRCLDPEPLAGHRPRGPDDGVVLDQRHAGHRLVQRPRLAQGGPTRRGPAVCKGFTRERRTTHAIRLCNNEDRAIVGADVSGGFAHAAQEASDRAQADHAHRTRPRPQCRRSVREPDRDLPDSRPRRARSRHVQGPRRPGAGGAADRPGAGGVPGHRGRADPRLRGRLYHGPDRGVGRARHRVLDGGRRR